MTRPADDLLATARQALIRVRHETPLVQCLTNQVVSNFTANVLLALGAAPAMVDIHEEAGPFARAASGVLVNLGTPHAEQRAAMTEAVASASRAGTPWVLDPVAIGSLPVRTALAHRLAAQGPAVVRGNASEIIALAGTGGGGRGVDATDEVESAAAAAGTLARATGAVVAVSGPVDLLTDGERTVRVTNGDPLLTRVTGGGCALGAVLAAFAPPAEPSPASDGDRLAAAVAAVTVYTVAAEVAAEHSTGPGSFAVAFLDALYGLDEETLEKRAAISWA
ncbi:hydroxyethylthiazole kinase [Streptomyces ochraceiscleroticus]|uniref:Hydroxyethylthiazole kinase n=1 Tax=Streptomyces ochraceiscleroticus TaxID=47761 RepID=A0ABW1MS54_9ACTN|nr:hydroxyethylthiazole kinase [Streptomyces ochraceiscleroticus]